MIVFAVATYAIGDVQGCFHTLCRLLERLDFDAARDRIWAVGDLVNRGPRSLEVLRWARGLGGRLTAVLGNHDLHLLALARGVRPPKPEDTLEEILSAPDRDALLDWLLHRPLLHREDPYLLVHAGVLPCWSVDEAEVLARELEEALRSDPETLLRSIHQGGELPAWSPALSTGERLRLAAYALARLRTCTAAGRPCRGFGGPPEAAPRGCLPWFGVPERKSRSASIIFGHWSALGLYRRPGLLGLDTGCVWGGKLTAVRLEDGAIFNEPLADG